METTKYVRKPFAVDAVQVTTENIAEVAAWCQGLATTEENGTPFIKVHVTKPLNENQTKAKVGDWVLYAGTGFKVYTNKAFVKSFELFLEPAEIVKMLGDGTAFDAEVPTSISSTKAIAGDSQQ